MTCAKALLDFGTKVVLIFNQMTPPVCQFLLTYPSSSTLPIGLKVTLPPTRISQGSYVRAAH